MFIKMEIYNYKYKVNELDYTCQEITMIINKLKKKMSEVNENIPQCALCHNRNRLRSPKATMHLLNVCSLVKMRYENLTYVYVILTKYLKFF